jgi:hypothetical protein
MADRSYPEKIASLLKSGVQNQWEQGRPYREALGGLLSGDVQPLQGLLGSTTYQDTAGLMEPQSWDEMMTDPGMQAAMNFAPMGLGMIKTKFGRIPETSSEASKLADMLQRAGERSGYRVNTSSSKISPSQYISFTKATDEVGDTTRQVRISNHADKYPELADNVRISADPSTEVTFEQAVNWLGKQGYPTSLSNRYSNIPSHAEYYAQQQALREQPSQKLDALLDGWRNMPKATRGEPPTMDDIKNGMTIMDIWKRGR